MNSNKHTINKSTKGGIRVKIDGQQQTQKYSIEHSADDFQASKGHLHFRKTGKDRTSHCTQNVSHSEK
jgi:hypothetical protein